MRILFVLLAVVIALPASASSTWVLQDDGTMQSIRGITGNGNSLVAVGNTGNRMRSTDGGTTWTLLSSTGSVWWHDVTTDSGGNLLAVGESGAYASSSDLGATWTSASLGNSSHFYDIDRASSSTGYIVGAGGTVLYYANATGRWSVGSPNVTEDLYAVQDNGDGTAWIVGNAGRMLKAANSGVSWTNLGVVSSRNLRGVYFSSSSTGWVVGEYGTLRKTTDGGSSWSDVSVDGLSEQHLYDIQASGDSIVVVGDKIVLLSEDGGDTWTTEDFTDENLTFYAAYHGGETKLWIAGTNNDVKSVVYHYEVEEAEAEPLEEVPSPTEESVVAEADPGNLIKLPCEGETDLNDPCRAVYYYATDLKRHAFPNEKVFFTWFDDFDSVMEVSADFLSSLSLGPNVTYHPGTRMVKFQSVPTVYAVEAGGVLRAIASEAVAEGLYSSDWNQQIDDVSDAFWGNYEFGETIDSVEDYDVEGAEASVASLDDNF